MPTFVYKARDSMGKAVRGTLEALSKEELVGKLHRMGYMVTQVGETLSEKKLGLDLGRFRGIRAEDRILFSIQLSNLINAGISLLTSLETLSQQIENRKLKEAIGDIARNVESGASFSEALAKYPNIFSKLFISAVKAGEASGKLDTVLAQLASFSEQEADLKQKVKGALFYPAILLAAGMFVTLYIVTFVVPQFAEIFLKLGIQLPLPTRILYEVGMAIKQFWYAMILFLIMTGVGIQYYSSTKIGRLQLDWLKLKLPLLGPLYRKAAISRFGRTLGMLVAAGVPLLQSLDIVRDIIGNEVLARLIADGRNAVEKGEKITETLKVSGEFPLDAIQMISVGEETGRLDHMLNKVSEFYDRSVGYTVRKLTTVLEPLLLAVMGGLVGFIMASMLLPMFDMIKILRH